MGNNRNLEARFQINLTAQIGRRKWRDGRGEGRKKGRKKEIEWRWGNKASDWRIDESPCM